MERSDENAPFSLYKKRAFYGSFETVQKPLFCGMSWTLTLTDAYFAYYKCKGELCSPAKNNVIDTLKGAIKGSFSFNMPFPMNSGRQKSAGIQPPKTAPGQDLKR